MTSSLRKFIATLLALAVPIVLLVSYLSLRGRLPDPLPTHWSSSGPPDGFSSQAAFACTLVAVAAVLAVAMVVTIWAARPAIVARMGASLLAFFLVLTLGVWLVTSLRSLDVADPATVQLPFLLVVLLLVACVAAAMGVWLLLPGQWQDAWGDEVVLTSGDPPPAFAADEQVVWVDRARSGVFVTVGTALAVGALVAALWIPTSSGTSATVIAVIGALAAVPIFGMSSVTVRIDRRGVHTLWGPFGWPRSTIPLRSITAVRAQQIRPWQWGGWGYRVSQRGTATVIKAGPGIVIQRAGTQPAHAITLPHAVQGAQVLQVLLQQ